jgi:hypothetical protein
MAEHDPRTMAAAHARLKQGDLDGAVALLQSAGAFEEAARALGQAQRYVEGANLLLGSLGVSTDALGRLRDTALRDRAMLAASLLRRAGLADAADDIDDQLELTAPVTSEDRTVMTRRPAQPAPRAAPPEERTQVARKVAMPPAPSARPRSDGARTPARPPPPRTASSTSMQQQVQTRPQLPAMSPAPDPEEDVPTPAHPLPAAPRAAAPHGRTSTSDAVRLGLESAYEPGLVIAGRYELGPIIGRGGMARVFRAQDLELGAPIAVKVFDRMDDPTLLQRFKQELLLSRQISHPNVLRIFDIGTHAEQKYLTMELLVGQDLKERLASPIALSESLDLLIQVCRGLEAAHAAGVVHRDIKPQNLFLTGARVVKIMDFGIARLQQASRLTNPGTGVGTPEYMAPEQIKDSHGVSAATDLYALGVTAYRMCTGRVPFQDKNLALLLKKQLQDEPPPPRSINPRLPPQLEQIIVKLLAKDPAARYQSAGTVGEALLAVRARFAVPHG